MARLLAPRKQRMSASSSFFFSNQYFFGTVSIKSRKKYMIRGSVRKTENKYQQDFPFLDLSVGNEKGTSRN